MPVSTQSRYHGLDVYEVNTASGERRATIALRPPRPTESGYRHLVTGVEDMELLAWRYFGDSRQWWRIAEANRLRFPLDLVPGMSLVIPSRGDIGKIVRSRRF